MKLPSLTALRTFDAAAQTLSFKTAADILGLSPTAVSHQIRNLEKVLDAQLFKRGVRKVELTARGRELADELAPAFVTIRAAISRFSDTAERQVVTLAAGPLFTSRWLVPRLDDFWSAFPGIDLRLHHSPLPAYQQISQVDLAIAWGDGNWPGIESELFMRTEASPVYSPKLEMPPGGLKEPSDLFHLPLLHQRNHKGWRQWFQHMKTEVDLANVAGGIIEDANILLQAVLDGKGVGLGSLPLITEDLEAGRLIQPWSERIEPADAYHLIYAKRALDHSAVRSVRDWLHAQMER